MLAIFLMQQEFKGKLRVWVGGLYIPTSVVVAYDLAITLKHQLADPAAVDSKLGTFLVNLHPVMKNAVVNLKASFFHMACTPFVFVCVYSL